MRLLCLLRGVVALPVLRVLLFDSQSLGDGLSVAGSHDLALQYDLNRKHMLATHA